MRDGVLGIGIVLFISFGLVTMVLFRMRMVGIGLLGIAALLAVGLLKAGT